jgi:hypothetical protein
MNRREFIGAALTAGAIIGTAFGSAPLQFVAVRVN